MLDASMILCTHWRFYSSWIRYHVEKVGTWQKNILVNPLACNIFYTKKKKKTYVECFIISISWSWWKWHMVFKEWAELDPLRYKYSGGMRFSLGV